MSPEEHRFLLRKPRPDIVRTTIGGFPEQARAVASQPARRRRERRVQTVFGHSLHIYSWSHRAHVHALQLPQDFRCVQTHSLRGDAQRRQATHHVRSVSVPRGRMEQGLG